MSKTNQQQQSQHLSQYIFVEVGHVAMIRHRPIIVILEVLLQSHGVMWDLQHCVQVVGQHLRKKHTDIHMYTDTVNKQCVWWHFRTQRSAHSVFVHVSPHKHKHTHTSRDKQSSGTKHARTAFCCFLGFFSPMGALGM